MGVKGNTKSSNENCYKANHRGPSNVPVTNVQGECKRTERSLHVSGGFSSLTEEHEAVLHYE